MSLGATDMNSAATIAGIGDAGDHRLVAVEIAAEIGEVDLRRRNLYFSEDRVDQQIGQRAGRRHRDRLALQVLHLADGRAHHQPVRHARPVAAEDLDVGAARAGENRGAGLDSMLSISPASSALCAMAPFFSGRFRA